MSVQFHTVFHSIHFKGGNFIFVLTATKKVATDKDATKKDATMNDATKENAIKKDATKKDATHSATSKLRSIPSSTGLHF